MSHYLFIKLGCCNSEAVNMMIALANYVIYSNSFEDFNRLIQNFVLHASCHIMDLNANVSMTSLMLKMCQKKFYLLVFLAQIYVLYVSVYKPRVSEKIF